MLITNGNKIMIRKYDVNKVYNPKDFKHAVRRATKAKIEREYKYIPLQSRAVNLLMLIPGIKQVLMFAINQGNKLLKAEEQQRYKLLSKEE